MPERLLEVRNLKTYFYLESGESVKAVDGISFDVEKGEGLGLVGESGCGKTTAALSLMRLLPSAGKIVEGKILFKGDDLVKKSEDEMRRIRWKHISMVFQGSMNALNPLIKVGDQIAEAIILHEHGISKKEALNRAAELLELVGIERRRVNNYPFEFSGGMKQRTVIAMALALNPELVIADEPTTALDVIVEAQILGLMRDLKEKLNLSLIMITHDLSIVSEVCNDVAVMYAGMICEYGDLREVYKNPLHPYTAALVRAYPSARGTRRRLYSLPGFPPDLINPPSGCRFHPRCTYATDVCRKEVPDIIDVGGGHYVACHLVRG